jgi:hypothetical protein
LDFFSNSFMVNILRNLERIAQCAVISAVGGGVLSRAGLPVGLSSLTGRREEDKEGGLGRRGMELLELVSKISM